MFRFNEKSLAVGLQKKAEKQRVEDLQNDVRTFHEQLQSVKGVSGGQWQSLVVPKTLLKDTVLRKDGGGGGPFSPRVLFLRRRVPRYLQGVLVSFTAAPKKKINNALLYIRNTEQTQLQCANLEP